MFQDRYRFGLLQGGDILISFSSVRVVFIENVRHHFFQFEGDVAPCCSAGPVMLLKAEQGEPCAEKVPGDEIYSLTLAGTYRDPATHELLRRGRIFECKILCCLLNTSDLWLLLGLMGEVRECVEKLDKKMEE